MASEDHIKLLVVIAFAVFTSVKSDFKSDCLFAHNKAREQHVDTPPVTWDETLASQASKYALDLMVKNAHSTSSQAIMVHSNYQVGENIFVGNYGMYSDTQRTIADAVSAWYAEGIGYNYNTLIPYSRYLHFTQVIWRASTRVGCGKATYKKNTIRYTVIVCQYLDTGNISIGFIRNVKPLKAGGRDRLSAAELTPAVVRPQPGGTCTYTDTGPVEGCAGMKDFCYSPSQPKPLRDYLQANCKKTCNC